MTWSPAPEISRRISFLIQNLNLDYIKPEQIHCFRGSGSSSRATARIWSLPTIWQQALSITPAYCIEVIAERFDRISPAQQEKVLIHELLHIPKTFSGSLVAHRTARHRTFRHYHDTVDSLFHSLSVKSYE